MKTSLSTHTSSAFAVCSLPAQTVDAIITHFSQGVMAGEEWLPAGNYTISASRSGTGNSTQVLLRFQAEDGGTHSVMATRGANLNTAQTQVQLAADKIVLRVSRVIINGAVFTLGLIC